MTVEDLLSAARSGLLRGAADDCVEAACLAFATAEDAATRARAATLAGGAMLHMGLPADAIMWADRALALAPGDGEALAHRGWAQQLLGRHDEALADLDAAVAARPDLADARISHAIVAHDAGRVGDADADLDAIVDDPRQGAVALRIRGEWERDAGDLLGARADFAAAARHGDSRALERLLAIGGQPDDPELLLTWARLRARHGEPQVALDLVEQALLQSDLTIALRATAEAERAALLLRLGDDDGALAAFTAAVALAPDDPIALAELGGALGRVGQIEQSLEALDRALAIDPDSFLALIYRAEALMDGGAWGEAEVAWRELMRVAPTNPTALVGHGRALLECDRRDEAAASLRAAAVAGSVAAAEWCHDHLLVLPADHASNGQVALEDRDYLAAADHFEEAAAAYLEYSHAEGDHAHREAASALAAGALARHRQHDDGAAVTQLERAVSMRPTLRDAWLQLGDARSALGRHEAALAALDRCAWIDPWFADVQLRRAEVLRRIGRADEHLAALDRAIELATDDHVAAVASWKRGAGYQAVGCWDEAEADYRGCAALGIGRVAAAVGGIAAIRGLALTGAERLIPARYRRYGLTPSVWSASRELRARLQFVVEPDAVTRAAIGHAAYAAASPWFETDAPGWRWADRFVMLRLRSIDDDPAFEGMAQVIAAIDAVSPLVEAVGWNAIGVNTEDADELWAIASRPVPDPGPDFPEPIAFWVSTIADTRRFARPYEDDDFDEAWQDAAADDERLVAEARASASAGERARGEIVLVPVDERPLPPELPAAIADQLRDDYDMARLGRNGSGVILRHQGGYYTGLDAVSADGEVRTMISVEGASPPAWRSLEAVSVASDGRSAVFVSDHAQVVERVDLVTGMIGEVVRMSGEVRVEATAILADGRVAVRTGDEVVIHDLATGPVARAAVRPGPMVSWSGGRLLLFAAATSPELMVYGWRHGLLEPIAELGADIAPESLEVIGERAFCRGLIEYEILDLEPSWQLFAAWADAWGDDRDAQALPGQLLVEEVPVAPTAGVGEAADALRAELGEEGWCVTGPAGLAFVLRPVEGAGEYVAVAGDELGLHPILPEVVAESFGWQMREDGGAVLVVAERVVWELDLAVRTAHRLVGDVSRACYTADGFATIAGGDLVLYRWGRGRDERPTELERIELESEGDVTDLSSTAEGRVILLGIDGKSLLLAVRRGDVHPVGRFDGAGWSLTWTRAGIFYLQAGEDDDPQVVRYRIGDASALWDLAMGSAPVDRIATWSVTDAAVVDRPAYPHRTHWSLYGDDES